METETRNFGEIFKLSFQIILFTFPVMLNFKLDNKCDSELESKTKIDIPEE